MKISLILPLYNEEELIRDSLAAIEPYLQAETADYEIILVDDGSQDKTWSIVTAEALENPHIYAISLSRNFGKEAAIAAGLDHCSGDCVILMDADLQHPPHYIPELLRLWRQGYDVVEGVKADRGHESKIYRFFAKTFYKVFSWLSNVDLEDASDFKLLDRQVVLAWRKLDERHTFFRGLAAWLGFKHISFEFEVAERAKGDSKWNFRSLWRLTVNALTSFSSAPLSIITVLGLIFLVLGLIIGLISLVDYFTGQAVEGFTTVILLILITGGSIMLSLGLIGTYISRIYDEVKGRPRYLTQEQIKDGESSRQKNLARRL